MPGGGLGPAHSARMTWRRVLGIWQGTCPRPTALVPVGVPGAQLPHQPVLPPSPTSPNPHPCPCPGLGPIPNGPPSMALAWPGLSVLPSTGGEGRSLQQQQQLGLWVIAGFLTFLALEKMFLDSKEQEESRQVSPKPQDLDTSASVVWWCQGLEAQVLSRTLKRGSLGLFLGVLGGWASLFGE